MKQRLIYSPGVQAMLGLRMDAAHGTPTIWEKIAAVFGGDGANNASVLAGDQRDLSQGEQDVVNLLQPLLHAFEGEGLADLTSFVQQTLTAETTATSVAAGVASVKAAAKNEGGTILQQIEQLGETSLTTLTSAALAKLGHVNLPAA